MNPSVLLLDAISIIYNETRSKLSGNGNKMWEKVVGGGGGGGGGNNLF